MRLTTQLRHTADTYPGLVREPALHYGQGGGDYKETIFSEQDCPGNGRFCP